MPTNVRFLQTPSKCVTHPPTQKKSDEGLETETTLRLNSNANCPKKTSNSIGSTFLSQNSPLFGTTFEGWVIRGQLSTAHPSALLSHSHLTPPQKNSQVVCNLFSRLLLFYLLFGGAEGYSLKCMKLPKSTTRFKSPKSCFSIRDCNALGTKSPRIRDSSQLRQSLGKWPPWSIFFRGPVSRKIRCFRPTLVRIPNINAYFLRGKSHHTRR